MCRVKKKARACCLFCRQPVVACIVLCICCFQPVVLFIYSKGRIARSVEGSPSVVLAYLESAEDRKRAIDQAFFFFTWDRGLATLTAYFFYAVARAGLVLMVAYWWIWFGLRLVLIFVVHVRTSVCCCWCLLYRKNKLGLVFLTCVASTAVGDRLVRVFVVYLCDRGERRGRTYRLICMYVISVLR